MPASQKGPAGGACGFPCASVCPPVTPPRIHACDTARMWCRGASRCDRSTGARRRGCTPSPVPRLNIFVRLKHRLSIYCCSIRSHPLLPAQEPGARRQRFCERQPAWLQTRRAGPEGGAAAGPDGGLAGRLHGNRSGLVGTCTQLRMGTAKELWAARWCSFWTWWGGIARRWGSGVAWRAGAQKVYPSAVPYDSACRTWRPPAAPPHLPAAMSVCRTVRQGLPYVEAPGEAEAMCAALNAEGLAAAAVTSDVDALLFGAKTVYRECRLMVGCLADFYPYHLHLTTCRLLGDDWACAWGVRCSHVDQLCRLALLGWATACAVRHMIAMRHDESSRGAYVSHVPRQ